MDTGTVRRFRNRSDAGAQLGERLASGEFHDPLILALPRGGVPVAFEIARALRAPLDVLVACKIGAPGRPEFGIGAIAEGGEPVADESALRMLGISRSHFAGLAAVARDEMDRRVQHYRGGAVLPDPCHHDVVLIDDGLATGVTAEAALAALQRMHARHVVLAVPVCAPQTVRRLAGLANEVICLASPRSFVSVGQWYDDFEQTTDEEVLRLLDRLPAADQTADRP